MVSNVTNDAISLTALTELKAMRMNACDELQRRSRQPFVYARDTALELLGIEKPRTYARSKHRGCIQVVVPSLTKRSHVSNVQYLAWTGPIETIIVGRKFECLTPVCA